MKLLIDGIRCGDCIRNVTNEVLKLDLGARINFPTVRQVRIEGRLSLMDVAAAIERIGFKVASVLDDTVIDSGFRSRTARDFH
jgi:copper chaperone CopZ